MIIVDKSEILDLPDSPNQPLERNLQWNTRFRLHGFIISMVSYLEMAIHCDEMNDKAYCSCKIVNIQNVAIT